MAVIDKIPFNEVPDGEKPHQKWAFDPVIGPFIRKVLDILNQGRDRTGGDTDQIEDLELSLVTGNGENRSYRVYEDKINDLEGQVAELKRGYRALEQLVHSALELNAEKHRSVKRVEQELRELEERYDSGT